MCIEARAVRRESVDAARIRCHRSAVLGGHGGVVVLGDAPHPQTPHFLVRFQYRWAHHLRQVATSQTPQALHLPQALRRSEVSLREQKIVIVGGVDVRFA